MYRVLLVDDEENIRLVLATLLKKHGYSVETAKDGPSALSALETFNPHFVLTDVRMPGMSGIDLCREIVALQKNVVVLVMSAFGSVDLAVEAMKSGAYDYVSKPFKQDEVLLALRKAQEREALRRQNDAFKRSQPKAAVRQMIGKSEALARVQKMIERARDFSTSVLIQGESGTGKELVARALHEESVRSEGPFVAVNCGAIPENLLESELFGHKKGAFTDASVDKLGLFEAADTGTLFLDEIGELSQPVQVKLLRVLQEGVVRRVGDTKDRRIEVRLVAATRRDLQAMTAAGTFREDLFFRINVLPIYVPPLRERKEDIALLAESFREQNNQRFGTQTTGFSEAAMQALMRYRWPGNVRELSNVVERAMVLADQSEIAVEDLPERVMAAELGFDDGAKSAEIDLSELDLSGEELSIKKATRTIEESLIRKALVRTKGNRTAAARILELSHRALLYKLKEYGIR